jgi:hypothetical protein
VFDKELDKEPDRQPQDFLRTPVHLTIPALRATLEPGRTIQTSGAKAARVAALTLSGIGPLPPERGQWEVRYAFGSPGSDD